MNDNSFTAKAGRPSVARRRWTEASKDKVFLLAIVTPAFVLMIFTIGIPIVKSLYMSFFHVTLLSMKSMSWNSFDNYKTLLADGEFFTSLRTTLIYVFGIVSLQFVLGLMLALVLNSNIRFRKWIRTLILVPWIIPTIIGALLWMWLFQPQYGVINYVLQALHLADKPPQWLGSPALALPAVMVAALWKQLPFMSTMLLAGLQGIPEDNYEAAEMDGANAVQQFRYVTLPHLKHTIKTVSLIAFIENFKMFPLFWIMTGGGPLDATTTLAIISYKTAFIKFDLGKGAAIGGIWLLLLLLFSWGYNRLFDIGEDKELTHS